MPLAKVKYQVATYRGTAYVNCEENDEDEVIIAKAKKQIQTSCHGIPAPMGYEHWKVVTRNASTNE